MSDFHDLIDGYHRFRTEDWARERERWAELSVGQHPKVMVIACSDSRVDPSQIADGVLHVMDGDGEFAPA